MAVVYRDRAALMEERAQIDRGHVVVTALIPQEAPDARSVAARKPAQTRDVNSRRRSRDLPARSAGDTLGEERSFAECFAACTVVPSGAIAALQSEPPSFAPGSTIFRLFHSLRLWLHL